MTTPAAILITVLVGLASFGAGCALGQWLRWLG